MTAGAQAAPKDAAEKPSPEDVQALLVDIFALTGQKVEIDDPLVAAALIHSALLRRAGHEAARAINQATQEARDAKLLDDDVQIALFYVKLFGTWKRKLVFLMIMFSACILIGTFSAILGVKISH